ncbi:MAG: sodium:proton antiporter [Planctomycetales bacterium]|nr:sodium:proton antiporter [Planctomycetales bacterium]
MQDQLFAFFLVLVPLLGIAAQWLAWRLQIPSILLLLGLGICLGFWITPDEILAQLAGSDTSLGPKLLFPIVSLSVAVILFEGGLTLHWNQLGKNASTVVRLITLSAGITWCLTALLGHFLLGFSWQLAWLLGAILMVTGPTVVGPLLRQIRPNRRVSSILQWEGILIDPVGAIAAVLVFEVIANAQHIDALEVAGIVLETLVIGSGIGCVSAGLLVLALRRYWIPDFLHGVFFLVVALGAFWLSNWMREESGLVTVTVLGICLANQRYVSVEHVLEFKEHLRVLLISCLFIVLGSRLQLSSLMEIGWVGIPFVLLLVFVVRPLAVFIGTAGIPWSASERLFVGLVAPRGIVAASVASVFGLKLVGLGAQAGGIPELTEKAALLAPVTFMTILGTVMMCGLGAAPLARKLGLADANPQGVLFAGAAFWVRELAAALKKMEIPVLLVDTNYSNVAAARMTGLPAKCGNILSEHIREELDLAGIGNFLAVTPSSEVNTLATLEYVHVFTRAHVFQLPNQEKSHERWQSIPEKRRGRTLFETGLHHAFFEDLFARGAAIKITTLTKSFTMEAFRLQYGTDVIVLGVISAEGKLRLRTTQQFVEPVAGDSVIAAIPTNTKPEQNSETLESSITGLY